MLERLVHGWTGKLVVLALLGFAATDFVITKTLSAADAAEHVIHNPLWETCARNSCKTWSEDQQRMALTMLLLIMLGASFHARLQRSDRPGRRHRRQLICC